MAILRNRIVEKRKVCDPQTGRCADIEVMFDTGADGSLIRREVFEREFPGIHPVPSGRFTRAHDGITREPTLGTVLLKVEVEKNKQPVNEQFEVVEHLAQEAIFGALGMENHGVDVKMRSPSKGGSRIRFSGGKQKDIYPGGVVIN